MTDVKNKGWRYKLGIFFLLLMIISPLIAVVIPYFELSKNITISIQGFFLIGGPEVFMILGIALAGKEGLTTIKDRLKKIFGLPAGDYSAPRKQYNFGLTLIILGMAIPFVISYIPALVHGGFFITNDLYLNLVGDGLFILGVFTAGQQFTSKIKSLFTWETWAMTKKEH